MNSDMDNHSEDLYSRFLTWLQRDSVPVTAPADGLSDNLASADGEIDYLDPLDLEELNVARSSTDNAVPNRQPLADGFADRTLAPSPSEASVQAISTGGEIPTVQNRFHSLLKRRLQVEIERHPPLFPWETDISEYALDYADEVADRWVSPISLWMPQIYSLNLPVSLPETALAQLLSACTTTMQSPLQQGAKMVSAVSSLYPDQSKASLNQLAGLVLLYPTRSPQEERLFTKDYETAAPDQKIALSLLAAREIIDALTLSVSPNQTSVQRQWQTSVGTVSLQVEYLQQQVPRLRVQSRLPKGGSLTLRTDRSSTTAERTYPGYLSVESFDLQQNQTYPLEVRFQDLEEQPLIFGVAVSS